MRILHLADFHLPNDPTEMRHGIDPHAHLVHALAVVRTLRPQPDLVVVGGDMFADGQNADYSVLQDVFSVLEQPVHLVMGNHDRLETYRKTAQPSPSPDFPGYYSFDFAGYHMVLLYSAGTGREYGMLDETQLRWLDDDLARSHPQPVLMFAHHPPVNIGVPWLDEVKLRNSDDLWAVVKRHTGRLCGLFVAHLHLQVSCVYRGVLVASCPSTSWQFSGQANAARAEMSAERPGFNVIDLVEGQVNVRTVRFEP